MNNFVHDIISTFNLTLPTILYDSDEPPEICYENTPDRRVLCLLATEQEQTLSIDTEFHGIDLNDKGMYVLKLGFVLKGQNRKNTKDHSLPV